MSNDFANTVLWDSVSGETEHFQHQSSLTHAKVRAASYWPFLAAAENDLDFNNRISIVSERLESAVGVNLYDEVIESLRMDYRAVNEQLSVEAARKLPHVQVTDRGDGVYMAHHVMTSAQRNELYAGASKDDALEAARKFGSYNQLPVYVNDSLDKEAGKATEQVCSHCGAKHQGREGSSQFLREHTNCSKPKKTASDSDNPYSTDERHECQACNGWGTYGHGDNKSSCSNCDGKGYVSTPKGEIGNWKAEPGHWDEGGEYTNSKRAYIDPSDADRYSHYPRNWTPVDNGDSQGPDGFPVDLAAGEDRSNPRLQEQAQGDGAWHNTPGTAMPERPMPQGIERGYQPVASLDEAHQSSLDYMYSHLVGDNDPLKAEAAHDDGYNWFDPTGEMSSPTHEVNYKNTAPNLYELRCSNCNYKESTHGKDNADFLADHHEREKNGSLYAEASHVPGFFDDTAMVNGYKSRGASLVEVEFFNVATNRWEKAANKIALVDPGPGTPVSQNPFYFDQGTQGVGGSEGFPVSPSPTEGQFSRVDQYGDVAPVVSSGSADGTIDGHGYSNTSPAYSNGNSSDTTTSESPNFNVAANRYEDEAGEQEPDSDEDDNPFTAKEASTDGKIVAKCPGCDKPLRKHQSVDGVNGVEFRHLHNDSVRCNPKKTAASPAATNWVTIHHPADEGEGGKYKVTCKEHGVIADHPDYGMTSAIAKDHQQMHQMQNHDDLYGQGAYERDFPHNFASRKSSLDDTMTEPEPSAMPNTPELPDAMASGQFFDPTLMHQAAYTIERPTPENPTGRGDGDEYKANTFDSLVKQRPMQSSEERNINTPVSGAEPIKTRNFNTPGGAAGESLEQSETADDEEE